MVDTARATARGAMNGARNEREVSQREGRVNVSNWVLRRMAAAGRRVAHTRRKRRRRRGRDTDDGIALLMALLVTLLLAAVSGGLLLLATTESRIAGAEEFRSEAHGVAEVMLERALQELLQTPDWSAVLAGAAGATFRDTASAPPWVAGWGALDLPALTRQVQHDADVGNRWGRDGPRWQLYAYGRADGLSGPSGVGASGGAAGGGGAAGAGAAGGDPGRERAARFYAIAWVADDPGEGDGDPAADRNETVQVRADAFGPMRTRHTVLATVRRSSGMPQVTSWREPEPP